MAHIYAPVFSQGKASGEAVTQFNAASTDILGVVVANFPVGTNVWTADDEAGTSVLQFRGKVTVSGGTQITVERAAAANSDASPWLWKATASWQPTHLHNDPEYIEPHGVDVIRALDGTDYATQFATAKEDITLRWDALLSTDQVGWRNFVKTDIAYVESFAVSWYDYQSATHRVATVKLLNPASQYRGLSAKLARALVISFSIQTEDTYT